MQSNQDDENNKNISNNMSVQEPWPRGWVDWPRAGGAEWAVIVMYFFYCCAVPLGWPQRLCRCKECLLLRCLIADSRTHILPIIMEQSRILGYDAFRQKLLPSHQIQILFNEVFLTKENVLTFGLLNHIYSSNSKSLIKSLFASFIKYHVAYFCIT